ncbi:MAG: DNA repair protein RecN [Gammaproteobacteria bacterium]|nr:DNA repair protein RecN [Gammaproteobacteria bacterium]
MLLSLQIQNYTIVDDLALDFTAGMTVLSGETGAGKSILLNALGLALGDRAESGVVAPGSERAEIVAIFSLSARPELQEWLAARELDANDECIIRRTISLEGRSRGYINGHSVPLTHLKELGEGLVELHGQHAHQSLLNREQQRQLLDSYAGITTEIKQLADLYQQWRQLMEEQEVLSRQALDRQSRHDLISFQLQELEQLNLQPGEAEAIEAEYQRLSHMSEIISTIATAHNQLNSDDGGPGSLLSQVQSVEREISRLVTVDARLQSTLELLEGAAIQLNEATSELKHYLDRAESDPERLQQLEDRLTHLQDLARKHRIPAEALLQRYHELAAQLLTLDASDSRVLQITKEIDAVSSDYQQLAVTISRARERAATALEKAINANIRTLGMGDGAIQIELEKLHDNRSPPSPYGHERIAFMVRTNPGHPFQPLNKVASGGELSRISLAIQVILASSHAVSTMIFDEVDVGVGGKTAEMVGYQLHALGERTQVICITHQPQVAAQGDQHLLIHKVKRNGKSNTLVKPLDEQSRVDEIARMSGGAQISELTRTHAKEMLQQSRRYCMAEKK